MLNWRARLTNRLKKRKHTWRKTPLKLIGLVAILDDQCVQVPGAADLEFEGPVLLLLNGHAASILAARSHEEVLDFIHLLRLKKSDTQGWGEEGQVLGKAVASCIAVKWMYPELQVPTYHFVHERRRRRDAGSCGVVRAPRTAFW